MPSYLAYGSSYGNWINADLLNPFTYAPDTILELIGEEAYIEQSGLLQSSMESGTVPFDLVNLATPLKNTKDAYARFGLIVIALKEAPTLEGDELEIAEAINELAQSEPSGISNSQMIEQALKNAQAIATTKIPSRKDEWGRLFDMLQVRVVPDTSKPNALQDAGNKATTAKGKLKAFQQTLQSPYVIGAGILLFAGMGYYLYQKKK